MFITVKKIRTVAAALLGAGLTGLLVVWPRIYLPRGHPPNLLTAGAGGAILLTALLAGATAGTAFLLPLILPRRGPSTILFFLTIGLATLSVFGSRHPAEVTGGELSRPLLMLRAVETILMAAIVLGGLLLWRRAAGRFWPAFLSTTPYAEGAEPPPALETSNAPEVEDLLPSVKSLPREGVGYIVAVAGIGYLLASQFVRADGRGHGAFGLWAAFTIATLAVHQFLRVAGVLLVAVPPIVVGLVGYVLAGILYGPDLIARDTRTLLVIGNPCDFVGPAVAGCMTGLWASRRSWTSRQKRAEKKKSQPKPKPKPAAVGRPPPVDRAPAAPRRGRQRRKRR